MDQLPADSRDENKRTKEKNQRYRQRPTAGGIPSAHAVTWRAAGRGKGSIATMQCGPRWARWRRMTEAAAQQRPHAADNKDADIGMPRGADMVPAFHVGQLCQSRPNFETPTATEPRREQSML